jgi:DNA-directed RNA polymerase specialized sigma24 family protein
VLLVVGQEWKQQEVAELLGISHSSVRSHLRRGMESLRKSIGERDG